MNDEEYPYSPELVLLKDNLYLRPHSVDYIAFTPSEDDPEVGTVQVLFNNAPATGVTVQDVKIKDFKRVADVANWDFNKQNTVS